MIGRRLLHYDITALLGEGGMGVVYRAVDTRLGRDVAIKLLSRRDGEESPERERLRIEARAAASLNHPNIATIHAIEESDEGVFIVMEYVEGRELREVIEDGGLSEQATMDAATQIAEGLQAAHRKGIVHRDIKSSNIMITGAGAVKIMDFGLARIGAGTDLTRSGTTLGTVAYMSPEQVRAETLDHRTDIWSFGVLLYEMVTGERPFRGEYDQAVLYAILNVDPELPATLTGGAAGLGKVVRKALEKRREARYQDMREVIADLAAAARDAGERFSGSSGVSDAEPHRPIVSKRDRTGSRTTDGTRSRETDGTRSATTEVTGSAATAETRSPRAGGMRSRKVEGTRSPESANHASPIPEVRYCKTEDGASIAYALHGSGPVLVRVLGWFTHLEMEWAWPALRRMWERIGERHTVVRYDGRGTGLSSPWNQDFTEEARQLDLDAVIKAVGAERVALYGISEGGWTAAHYAVRHPERVSHLIIYGSYVRGQSSRPEFDAEEGQALLTLMRKGWGRDTAEVRTMFTTRFFGHDADPGLVAHFNEMQRAATDGEGAARYEGSLMARGDATDVFARVRPPTLVIHCRDDRIVPFAEGQRIAATVPGATFLPLPTQTHYFPMDDEVTDRVVEAIRRFTGG